MMGTDRYYVVDCPSCRQLRIPSSFFTLLWDMKEPERRAIGRLLLERVPQHGLSLLLDQDQYSSLAKDLGNRSGRWPAPPNYGSGMGAGSQNRVTPAEGIRRDTPANGITTLASPLDQKPPSRKA